MHFLKERDKCESKTRLMIQKLTFQEEATCEDESESRQKATDKRTTVTSGKEDVWVDYCYKNCDTFILLHCCSFTEWTKSLGCHLIRHVGSESLAVPNCGPTSATPGTCLSSQGWLRQYRNLGKCSKTPGTETFRWGGTPPRPRGLHGRDFSEKLAEKVNGKGGYP